MKLRQKIFRTFIIFGILAAIVLGAVYSVGSYLRQRASVDAALNLSAAVTARQVAAVLGSKYIKCISLVVSLINTILYIQHQISH